jgi:sortase A
MWPKRANSRAREAVRGDVRRRPNRRQVIATVGILSIVAGALIFASIAAFYHHSNSVGHALVRSEQSQIHRAKKEAAAHPAAAPHCPPFSDSATGPQGIVRAPAIAMAAPVLANDTDQQLSVAVGHIAGSAWPGNPGTTVLAAHDVTYFSRINVLTAGQTVQFVTPCFTYQYRVTGHQIVNTGSPIYSSPGQSLLVLETCYPLNALYFTPQRYLVDAVYTGARPVGAPIASAPPAVTASLPAPAALAQQGLTLATNDVELGQLNLTGSPMPAWQQSPQPLDDETAALSGYIAGIRSAEQGQQQWWSQISPGVPFSASAVLRGAQISGYLEPLNPVLTVDGRNWTDARFTAEVRVTGGVSPGLYTVDVGMQVAAGTILISSWTMTPQT